MAETSHDVRRELEATRERVSDTIAALERKVNPKHWLDEYPLPALGAAFGAGVLLGSTGADRSIVQNTVGLVRTQLHSARDGAGHVMGALGARARHPNGNGNGTRWQDGTARAGTAAPGVSQALGDTVERMMEGVTGALISTGTAKLMQFMDRLAGQYTSAPRPSSPPSSVPLQAGATAGSRW